MSTSNPLSAPLPFAAPLTHRCRFSLRGGDALPFLQGLVSNDLNQANTTRAVYATLLTPQGKFRYEMIIFLNSDGSFAIEAEREHFNNLYQTLNRHRLRADIEIVHPDENIVQWVIWHQDGSPVKTNPAYGIIADPRLAALGARVALPKGDVPPDTALSDYAIFDYHRLRLGAPDGSRDLVIGQSTLAEGNLDYLNAISWNKGCYIGQELTARMHWRGLAKRRLMIVTRSNGSTWPHMQMDAPLYDEKRQEIGRIRSYCKDVALVLMVLENKSSTVVLDDGCAVNVQLPNFVDIEKNIQLTHL